jgi:hypothetical protein
MATVPPAVPDTVPFGHERNNADAVPDLPVIHAVADLHDHARVFVTEGHREPRKQ